MHDDLHWLVIPQRVQYKLAVTVHRCLRHRTPWYLADYCAPVTEVPGRQHLQFARCHQLSVPRVRRSSFATCAFSVARPTVWNSPLDHLRNPLFTPHNLVGTWRRICLPDIRSVSALQVLSNNTLQIHIYLLTYSTVIKCFHSQPIFFLQHTPFHKPRKDFPSME